MSPPVLSPGRGWSGFCSVPILAGTVLLVAALLKTQRLLTDAPTAASVFETRWFQVALVEAEVACALALWFGFRPALTRRAALLLFGGFLGVALSRALGGARTCACFGNVPLHPWLAVLLDCGVLAALACWRPCGDAGAGPALSGDWGGFLLVAAAFALLPVALFGFARPDAYPRLAVSPAAVELGSVQQGERRAFTMHLRNPHDKPVTIDYVRSSCPCLEPRGLPWLVSPGNEQIREFELDLAREPEFVGGLVIGLHGQTAGGGVGFSAQVSVTVTSASP